MKKLALLLSTLLALHPAQAQDNASFDFRVGHEKALRHVVIVLDSDAAPQTVANFENLLRHKFYNGLKIHRIIPHAIVQMGDPFSRGHDLSRLGTGGPGYTLPPEVHLRHAAGAVAMSRLPDTINPARRSSGSQFYVCLKPMPDLDGKYTVFGHVTQGLEVLDTLSTQPSDTNDNPLTPIVIKSAHLGSVPFRPFTIWPWGR